MIHKIRYDGSNYIAVPQFKRKSRSRRSSITREVNEIEIPEDYNVHEEYCPVYLIEIPCEIEDLPFEVSEEIKRKVEFERKLKENNEYVTEDGMILKRGTPKELFNEAYDEENVKNRISKENILNRVKDIFSSDEKAKEFVEEEYKKKKRNEQVRRERFFRKARENEVTHFVTITYDDKKQDEESFEKNLRVEFSKLATHNGWKIMGVFERSDADRLHFHGLINIPEDIEEKMIIKNVYSKKSHKRIDIHMHIDFFKKFGQNDFNKLSGDEEELKTFMRYITKYITKSNGKVYYSKGLAEYRLSDIAEEDVATGIGYNGFIKVLFKDFRCKWNGEDFGSYTKENYMKLPKTV